MRHDCTGKLRPSDYRRPECREIVVHRNTVADIYRGRNPDFEGDDCLATALFHQTAAPGTPEYFRIFPYHWFVDRLGGAHQCLPYGVIGQHVRGRNRSTVGLAIGWDCRRSEPPDHVYEAAARTIAQIWRDFGFAPGGCAIVEHDPLKPCPGPFLDMGRLKELALVESRR